MIQNNNHNINRPSFGMRFVYYNQNKNVPGYVERIIKGVKDATDDIKDTIEVTYNGHKGRKFKFTMTDSNSNKTVSQIFDRDVDFLDHKSFKYLNKKTRTQKLQQRVNDLELIIKLLQTKLNSLL